MQPRNQPTVATPKTFGGWTLLAIISGVAAAWFLQDYLRVEDETASVVAAPDSAEPGVPIAAERGYPSPAEATKPDTTLTLPAEPSRTEQVLAAQLAHAAQIAQEKAAPRKAMDACDTAIARAGIKLPEDFRVLAAGAYKGRDLGFRIDQSGNNVGQIDVALSIQDKPVAIMLGAYEPTVWNLSWTSGTRIVAVYVGGYHTQRLAGLPANVPLLLTSHDQKGGCPGFYLGGEGMQSLNSAARRVFGRPVDLAYPSGKDGTLFITGSGQIGRAGPARDSGDGQSYYDKLTPPAGQAGLEQAIVLGQLRRAGPADGELWALARRGKDVPPMAGEQDAPAVPPPGNVYIVLAPMTFPSGLYGANSVVFLVPPGVPKPRGDPGHSRVYLVR